MQATEAYIGSEQWPDVHVPEERSREMNDISFALSAVVSQTSHAHREIPEDEWMER